jgi:hypothetical protein
MLLLGVVLFVALVLVPALNMGEGLRRMLLAVYVETTAFLLAFKILIRRQPQRNSMIAVAFLGALALIVVKGFVSTETAANFVAPAVGSAHAKAAGPAIAPDPPSADGNAFVAPPLLSRSKALR